MMNGTANNYQSQQQTQEDSSSKVKTSNIQVCIRVRPLLRQDKTNDENSTPASKKTPSKRLSRLTPNLKRKQKKGFASLDNDISMDQDSNNIIAAWDVVSHDTVQQSSHTQRIKGRTTSYTLDSIYEMESSNRELYEQSVQPVVVSALEGYHASVFAYGQTSTGKTYTMTGTATQPGIVPLAVQDLFRSMAASASGREYILRVSYLEIYNEQVIDLLSDSTTSSSNTIRIMEHKGEVSIRGLREEVVTSPQQILTLLQGGNRRRQVGSTNMNQHSSRSHTIVRLWLESKQVGTNTTRVSSLNLVDLAGSESVRLTGSTGDRRREGQYINKSLMALGQVIYKLSELQQQQKGKQKNSSSTQTQQQQQHIPYRDSKLTRLLQPSLSGNAQIVCICTISPEPQHLEESHNTLKFATRAKKIQQRVVANQVSDQTTLLQEYKSEIQDLRQQLAELKQQQQQQGHSSITQQSSEDVKELVLAISKMEELILTANKLQTTQKQPKQGNHNNNMDTTTNTNQYPPLETPESGELLLTPDFTPLKGPLTLDRNNPTSSQKFTFDGTSQTSHSKATSPHAIATTPLYQEMHRVHELLDSVLQQRGLGSPKRRKNPSDEEDDENLLNVTHEEQVEELRHQLQQQEKTTSLKSADATFLQSQLREKDTLLQEVSNVLEAAEKRQLELETENAQLKALLQEKDRTLKYQDMQLREVAMWMNNNKTKGTTSHTNHSNNNHNSR